GWRGVLDHLHGDFLDVSHNAQTEHEDGDRKDHPNDEVPPEGLFRTHAHNDSVIISIRSGGPALLIHRYLNNDSRHWNGKLRAGHNHRRIRPRTLPVRYWSCLSFAFARQRTGVGDGPGVIGGTGEGPGFGVVSGNGVVVPGGMVGGPG